MDIKHKLMIVIIIIFSLIAISNVNASDIGNIQSTENGDFNTLANDIENASESKNFKLTKDYINNDENHTGGIYVNIDNLIIDGQGHTINANKKSRIFNIRDCPTRKF